MKQTRSMCLASASPRRKALLSQFGLEFTVHSVDVDESRLEGEPAADYARRLAALKAAKARARFADSLILAGDTVVALDGEVMGKPRDAAEARRMIARLSGRTHRVISAYTLLDASTGSEMNGSPETLVTFRSLPEKWITWYSDQPECLDKAGAYGIQGVGAAMVERIEGCYTTVMGFPIEAIIWDMLEQGWITL